ncbi:MAG: hypothetical protein ACE5HE_08180, partial [Phycisphaerae bacterium]
MNKRVSRVAISLILAGLVLLFVDVSTTRASDEGAQAPQEHATFLTTDGARKLGGAIGAGLVVMGGGAG